MLAIDMMAPLASLSPSACLLQAHTATAAFIAASSRVTPYAKALRALGRRVLDPLEDRDA